MNETERIRVAMLTTYMPAPSINGGIEHTRHLVKYLSRRDDVELHILALAYKGLHYGKDDLKSFTLHRIEKPFGYPFSFPLANLYLKREVERISPDIVHAMGVGPIYSPAAALVRHEYPTVVTSFTYTERAIKYDKRVRILRYFIIGKPYEKYVLSKIPNIIVDTSPIKKLTSTITDSKIYVIPAGIEFYDIQQMPSRQEDRPHIFSACRLHRIKGMDLLIRSIPEVTDSVSDVKVYIAGNGPQEEELRSLVKKLGLEDHVKFLGVVCGEEKYQYFKACKMVVVPSRWDAQTITAPEAMASGKPVVASNIGGLPDVIDDGKTGLLFESENVEDLAAKITTLLMDEELRERMGKAALEKAKEYDWSKIAARTVEVYREVIADFHGQRDGKTRKK